MGNLKLLFAIVLCFLFLTNHCALPTDNSFAGKTTQEKMGTIISIENTYNSFGIALSATQKTTTISVTEGKNQNDDGYGIQLTKTVSTIHYGWIGGNVKPTFAETITETSEFGYEKDRELSGIDLEDLDADEMTAKTITIFKDFYIYTSGSILVNVIGSGKRTTKKKIDGKMMVTAEDDIERVFDVKPGEEALLKMTLSRGKILGYDDQGNGEIKDYTYSQAINDYDFLAGKYVLTESVSLSLRADRKAFEVNFSGDYEKMQKSLCSTLGYTEEGISGYLVNGAKPGRIYSGDVTANITKTGYILDGYGNTQGMRQDTDGLQFVTANGKQEWYHYTDYYADIGWDPRVGYFVEADGYNSTTGSWSRSETSGQGGQEIGEQTGDSGSGDSGSSET